MRKIHIIAALEQALISEAVLHRGRHCVGSISLFRLFIFVRGQSYVAEDANLDVLEEVFAVAADRISLAMLTQVVTKLVLAILTLWNFVYFSNRSANREV